MERPDPLNLYDIFGATARPRHVRSGHAHPFNTNADIDGSSSSHATVLGKFRSTRFENPLQPNYHLPSATYHPEPEPRGQPRDILWTLNQPKWRPSVPEKPAWSNEEKYSRTFLHHKHAASQDTMRSKDITGPQFRIEEPRSRHTDPLDPAYTYDYGPVDRVITHVPRYGSRYVRKPLEDTSLLTSDIATAETNMGGMYQKDLIKTRTANMTSDIIGAQAWIGPLPLFLFSAQATIYPSLTNY